MDKNHPQYRRLMEAALELKKIRYPAEVARLLAITDQVLTNWKTRGIPAKELIKVSRLIGCHPYWLEDGEGVMVDGLYLHGDNMKRLLEAAEGIPDYAIPDAIARLNDLAKLLERAATQEQPQTVERRRPIKHGAIDFELRPDQAAGRRANDKKRSDRT